MPAVGAWQREDGRTAAVLHEVFSWLCARELARAGATCRAWHRAAAAPALWRRLLARRLADTRHIPAVSWRQEYVSCAAGWTLRARAPVGAVHGALAPDGTRLALLADDGALQVWEMRAHGWAPAWRAPPPERARVWRAAVRVQWPPAATDRLLVLGALALVDSWELLVLQLDDDGVSRVSARARCSAGAGGCWASAGGETFLSLELSVLAPRLACTAVWLNAAEQETHSEYVGVRAALLRVFNEDAAHITYADVAQVPLGESEEPTLGLLVTASGAGGGTLAAWPLTALRPPPVLAAELGDLRERVRRHAARPAPPAAAPEPPPPDEETVRALCTLPEATCALPAPPIGFLLPPSGRCVWVSLAGGGATCAELPTLRLLRHLPAPRSDTSPVDLSMLYYVQPSVSDLYYVSPLGSHAGDVCVWSVRSGAEARAPPAARPARPALAAFLPPAPPAPAPTPASAELLVLTGEHLYVWRSRSTPQPADEVISASE